MSTSEFFSIGYQYYTLPMLQLKGEVIDASTVDFGKVNLKSLLLTVRRFEIHVFFIKTN